MSQVLLAAQTAATAVDLVGVLAVAAIPGTIGAGVTIVDSHGKRTRAATDPLVEQADALQYQFNAGPCLSALRDRAPVRIDDVAAEVRWPQWTAAVASLGIRAMVSVPMITAEDAIGAIKVYSDRPGAYDTDSERLLSLFADQAAVLLANTQTVTEARQLSADVSRALDDRDVVSQATGVLVARGAVDADSGYLMLLDAAHRSNVSLLVVARRIIDQVVARNAAVAAQDTDRP
jgi:GAF domain-containing protein